MSRYKHKSTNFNGLSYKIQEYIKVPKNTAYFQYDMIKEFNKIFIEFLQSINVKHHTYYGKNASIISENYYKEFIAFLKVKFVNKLK